MGVEIKTDYQLQELSDDDLKVVFINTRSKINISKRLKQSNKELEMYYCYIVREMERRNSFFSCNIKN